MAPDPHRLEAWFLHAITLAEEERLDYVTSDVPAELRKPLLSLLRAHDAAGPLDRIVRVLGEPHGGVRDEDDPSLSAGALVGRYRIERLIARGGMGTVHLATRSDGEVEYAVALKVLRHDLQSPAWHKRFLVERQVLARVGHPAIAHLLDAGTTDDGRPWFAMEYVEGVPIVEHCDRRAMDVSDRLTLFRRVCGAVEHAHRHLVVHRDLKPANVLVNGSGEVKLVDFGIAKVLEPERVDDGRTAPGLRVLTPDYAAPEQLRGEPVTTATDLYQLGLLLHELLTGSLPPRPDTAPPRAPRGPPGEGGQEGALELPDGDSGKGRRSARGRIEGGDRTRRRLHGDLRAILDEALAPEVEDRYGTVEQLSEDIRRHMVGLPVRARAGRTAYHVAKFVRRHTAAVASAGVIVGLMVALVVVYARQAERVASERDRARQVSAVLVDMFTAARPAVARGDPPDALELLDLGAARVDASVDDPELAATMYGVLSEVEYDLARYPEAIELGWKAHEAWQSAHGADDPRTVERLARVAAALGAAGLADSAAAVAERATGLTSSHPAAAGVIRGRALQAHAFALQLKGSDDAARVLDSALVLYRAAAGDSARLALASALVNRAWLHENVGDYEVAIARMEESLDIRMELLDPDHPATINTLAGLGGLRLRNGDLDGAERLIRDVVDRSRRYYGAGHPYLGGVLVSHARVLARRNALDQAGALLSEAVRTLDDDGTNPSLGAAQAHNEYGLFLLRRRGLHEDAEGHLLRAVELLAQRRGAEDAWTAVALGNLADAYLAGGKDQESEQAARRAVDVLDGSEGSERYLAAPLSTLSVALTGLGRAPEAEPHARRALQVAEDISDGPRIPRARAALGLVLAASGDAGAVDLLRSALAALDADGNAHDPITDRARAALGELSGGAGR